MSAPADRIAQLERMLELEPGDAFCLYSLGQEHARAGRLAEAVRWYDRALEADPAQVYAHFHKARALEESGDIDAALETLRTGLVAAQAFGDAKAASEIAAYLDQLT